MEKIVSPDAELMRHYAALEAASHEMLQAAREGDWDSVCRLEGACAVVIARLRGIGRSPALTTGQRAEKIRIMRVILDNDAQLRRICQPMPSLLDMRTYASAVPAGTLVH